MSNEAQKTIVVCAGIGFLGLVGISCFERFKRRRAEEKKMKEVRHKVANLIKDVPGYSKPSR